MALGDGIHKQRFPERVCISNSSCCRQNVFVWNEIVCNIKLQFGQLGCAQMFEHCFYSKYYSSIKANLKQSKRFVCAKLFYKWLKYAISNVVIYGGEMEYESNAMPIRRLLERWYSHKCKYAVGSLFWRPVASYTSSICRSIWFTETAIEVVTWTHYMPKCLCLKLIWLKNDNCKTIQFSFWTVVHGYMSWSIIMLVGNTESLFENARMHHMVKRDVRIDGNSKRES